MFFAVVGALFGSSWIEAKRDENADFECLMRRESIGADEYRLRRQSRGYVCVYLDASGRTLREVRAETGISSGDAIATEAFVGAIAALIGGTTAFLAFVSIWLVWRLARDGAQLIRASRARGSAEEAPRS
ncbi:MAG TPA: hypothetical protein VGQ84_00805 [Gaiellaceae bacterium]|jgi:hypothetical protein|nr:hypothetical protein [Gaiellaceae bacterium]